MRFIILSVVLGVLILGTIGFSQEVDATKVILDNPTGEHCELIGDWDSLSKTCTLNTDLNEELVVGGVGITVDGNFHTLTGPGFPPHGGSGVAGIRVAEHATDITIKNFIVTEFLTGILVTGDSNLVTGNVLDGNFRGFTLSGQSPLQGDNTVKRNTITNSAYTAFNLVNTHGNTIIENNFVNNERKGTVSNGYDNTFFLEAPLGGNHYKNEGLHNYLRCTVIEGLFCVGPNEVMVFGTDSQTGQAILDERPYASMLDTIVFPDTDGDGFDDNVDNCPLDSNSDQLDSNNNELGDACDPETLLLIQLQEENNELQNLVDSLQDQIEILNNQIQSLLDTIADLEAVIPWPDDNQGQGKGTPGPPIQKGKP